MEPQTIDTMRMRLEELENVEQRLRHTRIHHKDAIQDLKWNIIRALEDVLISVGNARTAHSRPGDKKIIVDYQLNDALEVVTAKIEQLKLTN
tara:strand:+ start:839 stop:1114 length:276 start_codon:yes stop_codon:yes gene_type:complete